MERGDQCRLTGVGPGDECGTRHGPQHEAHVGDLEVRRAPGGVCGARVVVVDDARFGDTLAYAWLHISVNVFGE